MPQHLSQHVDMPAEDTLRLLDRGHRGSEIRQVVFDPCDDRTWLPTLTADQIAALWQRSVGGIKKACQQGRFVPAPFQVQPYRWRKADVQRHLQGGRAVAFPTTRRHGER